VRKPRVRTPRLGRSIAASLALAALCVLAVGASQASASSIGCWGRVDVAPAPADPGTYAYYVLCNQEVKSFSIVTNKTVDSFSTTADVTNAQTGQPVDKQSFTCEGDIPANGFGCAGDATSPNHISGEFTLEQAWCAGQKGKAWVVAVDKDGKSSGPFVLGAPKCKKPKTKHTKRRTHSHRR
jgi:hypothetical protein